MMKIEVIGNLGADAEVRDSQGQKFVTFRVASTVSYRRENGQKTERTDWIDCTISNAEHPVVPFLKEGQKVFVRGNLSLRVYSSPKDRCMKAGAQCSVSEVELVSSKPSEIPRQLMDPETAEVFEVTPFYFVMAESARKAKDGDRVLVDKRMSQFAVGVNGVVRKIEEPKDDTGNIG